MKYEHISIITGKLKQEELEQEIKKYNKYFKEHNIKVDEFENLGLKMLAYEIKENKKGYYLRYNLIMQDNKLADFERFLIINNNVIKFITIKVEE